MAPDFDKIHEYRELPILGLIEWDRVQEIRSVIRSLEIGQFQQASLLVNLMERDDRINGCLSTRILGLTGTPLHMEPALIRGRITAKTQRIADDIEERWEQLFPASSVGELLKWGLMDGIGIAEMVWDTASDPWRFRLKIWHPQFMFWDWSVRRYRLIVQSAQDADGNDVPVQETLLTLPDTTTDIHSDGHWIIYTPGGYHYAWLRGLVRPLAQPFLIRGWAYRDWARNSEINGIPTLAAKVPAEAASEDKDRFIRSLVRRGSEGVVELPQPHEGQGYDIDLVEATASNEDVFGGLLAKVEASIGAVVLGQNVAGEKPASIGSGQQNQDENIRGDLRKADAKIASVLRDQALWWYCEHNYGSGDLAPMPVYETDPPKDQAREAQVLVSFAQAAQTFASANVPVDIEAVLEEAGIPLLPLEEQPQEQPDEGEPGTTGLVALSARRAPKKLGAASRRYPDRLAAKARLRASKAIKPDLVKLNEIIGKATSFDDLRSQLGKLAEDMDTSELAALTEKSLILAELAGREEILRDL